MEEKIKEVKEIKKTIRFNEDKAILSQRVLVKVLKVNEYYFSPISEYGNDLFYCVIRSENTQCLRHYVKKHCKWAKNTKSHYIERPVSLYVCGCYSDEVCEPIVFDRKEIENIIHDVPETYVGEEVI